MTALESASQGAPLPPDEKTQRETKQAQDLGVSLADIQKLSDLIDSTWKTPQPQNLGEINQQIVQLKDQLKTQILEHTRTFLSSVEGDGSAKHPFQATEQAANEVIQKAALLAQLTRTEVFVKVDKITYAFKKKSTESWSDRGPSVLEKYESFKLEYADIFSRVRGFFESKHPERTFGQVVGEAESGLHRVGQKTTQKVDWKMA